MIQKISENNYHGTDGIIKARHKQLFGRTWVVAKSENLWYDKKLHPDKKPKTPIWFSDVRGDTPTLFIKKVAIGFRRKPKKKRDITKH